MRIAAIQYNDTTNGEGVCVSLWTQGCPHRCKGCHNPETWDFQGGKEIGRQELLKDILNHINANDVLRNFSILGGEPLAPQNIEDTLYIINRVKEKFPNIRVFLWTGYLLEQLPINRLQNIDIIIDGQFELENRDITLKWRGSPNQRILYKGVNY